MKKKIALLSTMAPGHMGPLSSIGNELVSRGHSVFAFCLIDTAVFFSKKNITPLIYAKDEYPLGYMRKNLANSSKKIKEKFFQDLISYSLRDLPELIRKNDIDLIVIDELQLQGETLAQLCNIPYVYSSCAFPNLIDRSGKHPHILLPWKIESTILNKGLNKVLDYKFSKILKKINLFRTKNKLENYHKVDDIYQNSDYIVSAHEKFDYKRKYPKNFKFVGPYINLNSTSTQATQLPKNKKIIYVCLGTMEDTSLKNRIYKAIARELKDSSYFIVFSYGRWLKDSKLPCFGQNTMTRAYVNQNEVLKRSSLMISHAGLNSTQEALFYKVPLIMIPQKFDQFGIAHRVERLKLGIRLKESEISSKKLLKVCNTLNNKETKERLNSYQHELSKLGGLSRACDIIEARL